MTSQGKQRARADARAVVHWGFRRPGQIGRRTAQRAASPIRQGHNNISRTARRMQRHQRQKLTTKRVMPIRYRDVGHQPVTDGGSLQVLGIPLWPTRSSTASFTMPIACSSAVTVCASRRRRKSSPLDRAQPLMERSHPSSGRSATPADINRNGRPTSIGTGGRHQSECPADIIGIRNRRHDDPQSVTGDAAILPLCRRQVQPAFRPFAGPAWP